MIFFASFIVNNLFLHQSFLKAHSQSNKLDKKCKEKCLVLKKLKNNESCSAC